MFQERATHMTIYCSEIMYSKQTFEKDAAFVKITIQWNPEEHNGSCMNTTALHIYTNWYQKIFFSS